MNASLVRTQNSESVCVQWQNDALQWQWLAMRRRIWPKLRLCSSEWNIDGKFPLAWNRLGYCLSTCLWCGSLAVFHPFPQSNFFWRLFCSRIFWENWVLVVGVSTRHRRGWEFKRSHCFERKFILSEIDWLVRLGPAEPLRFPLKSFKIAKNQSHLDWLLKENTLVVGKGNAHIFLWEIKKTLQTFAQLSLHQNPKLVKASNMTNVSKNCFQTTKPFDCLFGFSGNFVRVQSALLHFHSDGE